MYTDSGGGKVQDWVYQLEPGEKLLHSYTSYYSNVIPHTILVIPTGNMHCVLDYVMFGHINIDEIWMHL